MPLQCGATVPEPGRQIHRLGGDGDALREIGGGRDDGDRRTAAATAAPARVAAATAPRQVPVGDRWPRFPREWFTATRTCSTIDPNMTATAR